MDNFNRNIYVALLCGRTSKLIKKLYFPIFIFYFMIVFSILISYTLLQLWKFSKDDCKILYTYSLGDFYFKAMESELLAAFQRYKNIFFDLGDYFDPVKKLKESVSIWKIVAVWNFHINEKFYFYFFLRKKLFNGNINPYYVKIRSKLIE